MARLYCPHIETCPFYQNWKEEQDERIEVIMGDEKEGDFPYECIILTCLNNPERREPFPINNKLEKRLINSKQRNFECSHITLLNYLSKLGKI